MSDSLSRIVAIVRADFLLRFRRASTVVVFLLLSAFAYLWMPEPSTGRALLQINGQRALLNSGAIGMATASIGMIFVGLFGYYVISNAIRRDIVSRCGLIAASTSMRSGEYLLGKFLGNVAFLVTFLGGFMLSSMVDAAGPRGSAAPAAGLRRPISAARAARDHLRLGGGGVVRVDSSSLRASSATSFTSSSGWR